MIFLLSGLATKHLARQSTKNLCMIGTEEQAKGIAAVVLTM